MRTVAQSVTHILNTHISATIVFNCSWTYLSYLWSAILFSSYQDDCISVYDSDKNNVSHTAGDRWAKSRIYLIDNQFVSDRDHPVLKLFSDHWIIVKQDDHDLANWFLRFLSDKSACVAMIYDVAWGFRYWYCYFICRARHLRYA